MKTTHIGIDDATAIHATPKGLWRQDNCLVVRSHVADLPELCLVCGDAAIGRIKYNLRCKPRFWMLLFPYWAPFSPSVQVRPGLCLSHMRTEKVSRLFGHLILVAIAGLIFVPMFFIKRIDEQGGAGIIFLLFAMFLLFPLWVYYRTFRHKVLRASKIRGNDAIIESVPQSILARLPDVAKSTEPNGTK